MSFVQKINKPFLPIAAKQLSSTKAWAIVIGCLITGRICRHFL